jgi:hypothetical protein
MLRDPWELLGDKRKVRSTILSQLGSLGVSVLHYQNVSRVGLAYLYYLFCSAPRPPGIVPGSGNKSRTARFQKPCSVASGVLKTCLGLAGKITARIAADEFAHAPPLLASASTAEMGRDQHVVTGVRGASESGFRIASLNSQNEYSRVGSLTTLRLSLSALFYSMLYLTRRQRLFGSRSIKSLFRRGSLHARSGCNNIRIVV